MGAPGWAERLNVELGLDFGDIGIIKGPKVKLKPITLAMQQTLARSPAKAKKAAGYFGCVMCDELQRFAATTFQQVIDVFPAQYRIGWSADETRKDKKEFLIYSQFGKVASDIKPSDIEAKGLTHEVEVRVLPTQFKADWYRKQVQSDTENPDFNRLLEEMTTDKARNAQLVLNAGFLHTDGKRVLMMSHRREHVLQFRSMMMNERGVQAGVLMGGDDWAEEFAKSKAAMKDGSSRLAAGTYQAIGQGLDIPVVDDGIAATPIATNKQFCGQVRGRMCRTAPGKKGATLYYMWDQHVFGLSHLVNLTRWNRKVTVMHRGEWKDAKAYMEEVWRQDAGVRR
jgi:superfamily II DNA or RNA helicase